MKIRGVLLAGAIVLSCALVSGRAQAQQIFLEISGVPGEVVTPAAFANQIEIESTGTGPFSRGGDSGSLVYRVDGVALGLLFAGSESGGDNGTGLTYVNPIEAVLSAFGATLG